MNLLEIFGSEGVREIPGVGIIRNGFGYTAVQLFAEPPKIYTDKEVKEQRERFDNFLVKVNLVKLAKRILTLMEKDEDHRFVHRVLNLLAKVEGAMYYPGKNNRFYSEELRLAAYNALADSGQKKK